MSDTEDQPMSDTEAQDEGVEESVDEKDENTVKDENADADSAGKKKLGGVALYLTCRLCSSMYKRAVKLPCCNTNACRGCAVTHVTANKKCWNPKCEKAAVAADLVNNEPLRTKVEKRLKYMAKFQEDLKTGAILKCPVCEEICKRGVTLPCCGAAACRGCAVKKLAVKRGCWLEGCETIGVTGEELINDEMLRSAIDNFKKEGIVDEEQAREIIWNKNKLKNKKNEKSKKKTKAGKKAKKDDQTKQRRNPPKDKEAEESQMASIQFQIIGIPDDTSKEKIKEVFSKFGEIEKVEQQPKIKTVFINCGNTKTANNILEQKDKIKMGESKLKLEFSKGNNCADMGLYLTGMASDTNEEDLKDLLDKYGSVKDFKMGKVKSGEKKDEPYAIIKFEAGLSARKLINEKDLELNGEKVKVAIKNQPPIKIKNQPTTASSQPMVGIRGIFLKKDEAAILKLFEQFGKIEESKFFTKDLEKIPANADKLTGKERKKITSRAEIRYKKQNSAINAIAKEQLVHKGHTIFTSHKQGTGTEEFKTKLAEKLAANLKEKALKKKKAQSKPMGDLRRVIGFNTGMKRDSRGMFQNGRGGVWQNGRGAAPTPFHKDFRNEGPRDSFSIRSLFDDSGMSGGRGYMDSGLQNVSNMANQNMEMRMRNELMKQNLTNDSFFSGYGGGDGLKAGSARGGMETSGGGGWRNDNDSAGMWSRRDGEMGQNGGGIDMRGPSKFNQDFTSVTGMLGANKPSMFDSGANKPSMFDSGFDSGMSSQKLATDFDLRSSSNMRGMSGRGSSAFGMGGALRGRSGGMGTQSTWGSGMGGGRFSQDMDQVPRKIRRF